MPSNTAGDRPGPTRPRSQQPVGRPPSGHELEPLGVAEEAQRVYELLLRTGPAPVAAVAAALGAGKGATAAVLESLAAAGLVTREDGAAGLYVPAGPDLALETMVLDRLRALDQARDFVRRLERQYSAGQSSAELVETVVGQEAIVHRLQHLQASAQRELLVMVKPPYVQPSTQTPMGLESLSRGVTARVLYDQDSLTSPGVFEALRRSVAEGEQARVAGDLPMKLVVADRERALIPLNVEEGSEGAIIVRNSSLLHALVMLFEKIWQSATPVPWPSGVASDPAIRDLAVGLAGDDAASVAGDPDTIELARVLAMGLKDEAIARHLGSSLRTVRRRISVLMAELGARTRFQAGAEAARRGWL